jgi:hypothetical protein
MGVRGRGGEREREKDIFLVLISNEKKRRVYSSV